MSREEWSEELESESKSILEDLKGEFNEMRDNIADLEEAIDSKDVELYNELLDILEVD